MNDNKPKYRYIVRIVSYFFLAILCAAAKAYTLTLIFILLIAVYGYLSYKHRNDKYISAGEFVLDKAKGKSKYTKKKENRRLYQEQMSSINEAFDFDFDAYEDEEDEENEE